MRALLVFEELCAAAAPLTAQLTALAEPRDSFEMHLALLEHLLALARRPAASAAYKDACLAHARDLLRSSPDFVAVLPAVAEAVRDDVWPTASNAATLVDVLETCAALDGPTHFCSAALAKGLRKLLHSPALDEALRARCTALAQGALAHQRALIDDRDAP